MSNSSIANLVGIVICMVVLAGCKSDSTTPAGPSQQTTNLTVHTGVNLSAQASTVYGNLYDADRDTTYRIQFYSSRRSEIEFLYYFNPDSSAFMLASPDAPELKTVGNYFAYISSQTGAHSSNLIKLVNVTAAQFDALNDSTALKNMIAVSSSSGRPLVTIAANSVVAFTSSEGKVGLLKVVEFNGNEAASSMKINVKMVK
jgi:hypothetical protein